MRKQQTKQIIKSKLNIITKDVMFSICLSNSKEKYGKLRGTGPKRGFWLKMSQISKWKLKHINKNFSAKQERK